MSSLDRQTESEKEKEKQKRRLAWMIQQEKEREHERLKRKKIEEYERKRVEQLGLNRKRRSPSRSHSESRSRSRSEESHHRSRAKHRSSRSQVMSDKLNSLEGNKAFFNGPTEVPKLDEKELRQVVVNIHRKIPASATETSEIRRVVNHEEIILTRRDGEGAKPIFDRDELKQSIEVEEHRTIEAIDKSSLVKKSYPKRRSVSLSPRRHRSPSPHFQSSSRLYTHRSRHDEYSRHHLEDRHYKDHKNDRHYSESRDTSRDESRRRRSPRGRSHSRERDYHRDERDYSRSSRSEKEYREYRGRSHDRSYDRRDRTDSRERRLPPAQYVEQVPFPVYYSTGFAPRPMLVGPPIPAIPPLRGPLAGRGRPLMAPMRPPFPPHFIGPQDMYRAVLPSDPRFGRMY
nr:transformer F [Muscidifurax uniraptor]